VSERPKTTDQILAELKELRREVFMLIGRMNRIESRIEEAIDAPTVERLVVPASVVGTAAQLGEELTEGRRITKAAKESAKNLRRVVSPEDDTGSYMLSEIKSKKGQ